MAKVHKLKNISCLEKKLSADESLVGVCLCSPYGEINIDEILYAKMTIHMEDELSLKNENKVDLKNED